MMTKQFPSPGPMRPATAIEKAAQAARDWRDQYRHWRDDDTFADGTTKGQVNARLNTIRHTPEEIARVLNAGWAYPACGCCGNDRKVVVEFSEDCHDKSFALCSPCIRAAADLAGQFPDAEDDVP